MTSIHVPLFCVLKSDYGVKYLLLFGYEKYEVLRILKKNTACSSQLVKWRQMGKKELGFCKYTKYFRNVPFDQYNMYGTMSHYDQTLLLELPSF